MKKSLLVLLLSLPLLLAGPLELASGISLWDLDGAGEKTFSSSISEDSAFISYNLQIQENSKREEKREERTNGGHREVPRTSTYFRHAIVFNKAPPV